MRYLGATRRDLDIHDNEGAEFLNLLYSMPCERKETVLWYVFCITILKENNTNKKTIGTISCIPVVQYKDSIPLSQHLCVFWELVVIASLFCTFKIK